MEQLNIALKEWACVVLALERGQQSVIFRKGGIVEPEGDFRLEHQRFLLYPTFEHQKPELLKPEFFPLLQESVASRQGNLVRIASWGEVAEARTVTCLQDAAPFGSQHIWNQEFIEMRLAYKPHKPLWIVTLKVLPLPQAIEFVETTEYAGCKSWVTLDQPVKVGL
jgi:hypothetical protein